MAVEQVVLVFVPVTVYVPAAVWIPKEIAEPVPETALPVLAPFNAS